MAFRFILPASRPFVAEAQLKHIRPAEADRNAAALRSDFERWSRWGLGILSFVLAAGGGFVSLGMIATVSELGLRPDPIDLGVTALAAIIGLAGITMLLLLWWTGRRLLTAITWWFRLPYTEEGRDRRAGGWLQARTVNFEPHIFARIMSATSALLIAVAGISLSIRDFSGQVSTMTVASAFVGALALATAIGQTGGVVRLVSALSEADPLWVRIRSAFRSTPRSTPRSGPDSTSN